MPRRLPLGVLMLMAALGFLVRGAEAGSTDWKGDARALVRLVTATDTIDGSSLQAGLEFRYAAGWHGYWRTPGDAGIAPVLDWSGSRNLEASTVSWPAPTRLVVDGLQNAIYEGRFTLPVRLDLAVPRTTTRIVVAADYAACAIICVPIHADLALDLPVGAGLPSAEATDLAAIRAKIPSSPASAGFEVVETRLDRAGSPMLAVTLRSRGVPFRHPDLFVEGAGFGLPPAPRVRLSDEDSVATFTAVLPADLAPDAVLAITIVDGNRVATFATPAATPSARTGGDLLAILATALLGGLILNLMPCVLPILSIKLFGLARHAGGARRTARLGFVASALGIVTCFLTLAIVLIGLKWSGASLGWGIQFQQPWFLAGMVVLTTLFAASFFEWLPIGLPRFMANGIGGTGTRGALLEAFLAGMFSTLLATPCSAPFVGKAVGFALAGGARDILAVFLCLGLGMALPFLIAASCPGIVAWLPRPGPWMVRLRQGLGLVLLGTAAWLLVVLWSVAGPAAATWVTALSAILLAFRAWVSVRPAIGHHRWPAAVTSLIAIVAVAIASLPSLAARPEQSRSTEGWQAFDPDAIAPLVAAGRTVLVDVTASWCLTCKVNELTTLGTMQVRARLDRSDTVRMRADWSRPNPAIAAYMRGFARYGIPLDVVYGPDRPGGEALPEVLSAETVIAALDRATGVASRSRVGGRE